MSSARNSLPRDYNQDAIQVPNTFVTTDATGTPQLSPLAISTTIATLTVPTNAIRLIVHPDVVIRISEDADMLVGGVPSYDLVSGTETIPCGDVSKLIYVRTDAAATGTLYFRFEVV